MSVPTIARAAKAEKRINEAYEAAANGEGWVHLGRLWGMTNASALMWCQSHVPEAIWKKIGQNGMHGKYPTRGRRGYYYAKPEVKIVAQATREPNQFCLRVRYAEGQLNRCYAETKGKTYCKSCAHELATQHCGSNYRNYALVGRTIG